jgi:hypothetical protein
MGLSFTESASAREKIYTYEDYQSLLVCPFRRYLRKLIKLGRQSVPTITNNGDNSINSKPLPIISTNLNS